ncbi:MAG: hypothetical protein EB060_04575 [Proteobacteria bacterium]|nr:hypothetical protein [Pseudomonadota bacterium]
MALHSTQRRMVIDRILATHDDNVIPWLWDHQRDALPLTANHFRTEATYGIIKDPMGSGKSIIAGALAVAVNRRLDGDFAYDRKVLAIFPTGYLRDQFIRKLHNAELFGVPAEHAQAYIPGASAGRLQAALDASITAMTFSEAKILYADKILDPAKYDLTIIDEAHLAARGNEYDGIGRFVREVLRPNCHVVMFTATDIYLDGLSVADYVLDGKPYIREMTFKQAAKDEIIAETVNVVLEVNYDPGSGGEITPDGEYTEAFRRRVYEQSGIEEAAFKFFTNPRTKCPLTGTPFRDMQSIWRFPTISLAGRFADRLNDFFGEGYAQAVSGQTDSGDLVAIVTNYNNGTGHCALTNAEIISTGADLPPAQIAVDLSFNRSPIPPVQFFGRIDRRHEDKRRAYGMTATVSRRMFDQAIPGEVLGGLWVPDEEATYQPSQSGGSGEAASPFPTVDGLTVHYYQRDMHEFLARRQEERDTKRLPIKDASTYTLPELAKALKRSEKAIEPLMQGLEQAYVQRRAQEQTVAILGPLTYREMRFPIDMIGYFRDEETGKRVFGVNKLVLENFRGLLYGKIKDQHPPEALTFEKAAIVLRINRGTKKYEQLMDIKEQLSHNFSIRPPLARSVSFTLGEDGEKISISVPVKYLDFHRDDKRSVDLYLYPDALQMIYQGVEGKTADDAKAWWEGTTNYQKGKTREWKNREEFAELLGVKLGGSEDEDIKFAELWGRLQKSRTQPPTIDGHRTRFEKRQSGLSQEECLNESELEWVKHKIGMESRYRDNQDPPGDAGSSSRPKRRRGR